MTPTDFVPFIVIGSALLAGTWVDTSYLGSRRGKYAGLGDSYNEELNEFVSPSSKPVV